MKPRTNKKSQSNSETDKKPQATAVKVQQQSVTARPKLIENVEHMTQPLIDSVDARMKEPKWTKNNKNFQDHQTKNEWSQATEVSYQLPLMDLTLDNVLNSAYLRENLHPADQFTLSKRYPGRIDSPYWTGSGIAPVHTAKISAVKSVPCITTTGTGQDYTIAFFSPTFAATLNPSAQGSSGVVIYSYKETNASPGTAPIFGLQTTKTIGFIPAGTTGATAGKDFPGVLADNPWTSFWGSNPNDLNGFTFPYASELTLSIEGTAVNTSGTVYRGRVSVSECIAGITFPNLLARAERTPFNRNEEYGVRCVIRNNNLITLAASELATQSDQAHCGLESVSYIIVHKPFVSTTDGSTSAYTIVADVKMNYAYVPLANNIWNESRVQSVGNSETSQLIQDEEADDSWLPWLKNVAMKVPSAISDVMSVVDKAMPYVTMAASLLATSAGVLKAPNTIQGNTTGMTNQIFTNESKNQLKRALNQLSTVNRRQNKRLNKLEREMRAEYDYANATSSRLGTAENEIYNGIKPALQNLMKMSQPRNVSKLSSEKMTGSSVLRLEGQQDGVFWNLQTPESSSTFDPSWVLNDLDMAQRTLNHIYISGAPKLFVKDIEKAKQSLVSASSSAFGPVPEPEDDEMEYVDLPKKKNFHNPSADDSFRR